MNFEIGVAGTGQPAIVYPQLSFQPQAFFMMGSPVGNFIYFIYLLGKDLIPPLRGMRASTPRKKRRRNDREKSEVKIRVRGTGGETSYPNSVK